MRLKRLIPKTALVILIMMAYLLSASSLSAGVALEGIRTQFQEITRSLKADQNKEMNVILGKWNKDLSEKSGYLNDDFLMAISTLQDSYYRNVGDLWQCFYESTVTAEKQYSEVWLDDLIKRFGKELVQKNEEAILAGLQAIYMNSDIDNCGTLLDAVLREEAMLYEGYRRYAELFLEFCKTLNKTARPKMSSRKEAVESFLALIGQISITDIYANGMARRLERTKAERLNKEVFAFLDGYPGLHNLDLAKAKDDLFKITRAKSSAD